MMLAENPTDADQRFVEIVRLAGTNSLQEKIKRLSLRIKSGKSDGYKKAGSFCATNSAISAASHFLFGAIYPQHPHKIAGTILILFCNYLRIERSGGVKIIVQDQVRHNQKGFADLASLYAQTKNCYFDNIEFDMQSTRWFDADMCAVFGAILYRLGENLNAVRLTNLPSQMEKIFSRNGFLSHYGRDRISDFWSTAIPYQRFDIEDDRYFSNYIEKGLVNRQEFPNMSPGLHKQFRQSILEIFNNAVVHSQSDLGVFSCGQFFPHRNRLVFSVVDLGVGIRENVSRYLNMEISPEQAIDWATRDNNTTKNANIPGGLGLKLLREFIDLNGGCIQIVSDTGYWCRKNNATTLEPIRHPLPGTVVNLDINTADESLYYLESEYAIDNIF